MRKVLFITHGLGIGGAERVLLNYLNIAVSNPDYEISLMIMENENDHGIEFIDSKVKVIHLLTKEETIFVKVSNDNLSDKVAEQKEFLIRERMRRLEEYLRIENYDLIIDFNVSWFLSLSAEYKINSPIICWIHSHALFETWRKNIKNCFTALKQYHSMVAICDDMKKNYETILPSVFHLHKKVVKIFNPIDYKYILNVKDNENIVTDKNLLNDDFILQVARLEESSKNHLQMLDIYHKLKQKGIKEKLYIIGDGPKLELEKKICELGLENDCLLLGSRDNPFPFMKKAKLFIHTAKFEGLPTVLIESMICGTPVVAFDCPTGPREILGDGKYGKLIPMGDEDKFVEAVYSLLRNEALRQDYIKLLPEATSRFSMEKIGKQFFELVENIITDSQLNKMEEEKKLSIEEAEKADIVKILEMERGMVTQADFIKILGEYDNYILKYPDVLTAYVNRANTLQKLGLYEMALRDVDYAISRKKNYGFAYCHRSFISILLGRYEEGWKEFEWRLDGMVKDSTVKDWPISRWQGEELNGNTLIILPEQGLGDVIQFIRYAIVAKEQGLNIVVKNRDALDGLLSYSLRKHGIPILGRDPIPSAVAAYAHVMSFPHLFKTTLENIPYSGKYLEVEPEFEQKWRNLLGQKGHKKRIGIVWAGSKDHNRFRSRNMSFEQISSLFALDAEFYCLQKEVDSDDREKAKAFSNLSFWDDKIESFSDTAGLVSQLDLVISVDTSVAHLSAAMAIPTWIMITYNPDFRWLLEREDSPWYDSVRLFRQSISLTWESVIENVKESLKKEL